MAKKKPATLTARQLAARVKKFEKTKDAFSNELLDMQMTMENESRRHDYEIVWPLLDKMIDVACEIEDAARSFTDVLESIEIQDEDEA